MSHQTNWPLQVPMLVDFVAPIDVADPSSPVVFNADGVMTTYVVYPHTATKLAVAMVSNAVIVLTADDPVALGYEIGSTIRVALSDHSYFIATATFVTTAGIIFTPAGPVSSPNDAAKIGAEVIRYASPVLVGASYGTPAIDTTDWGWVDEVPITQLVRGKVETLRLDSILTSASTGARCRRQWDVVVSEAIRENAYATWELGEPLFIDIAAPLDRANPGAPIAMPATSIVTARVYRYGVETRVVADISGGLSSSYTTTDSPLDKGFIPNNTVDVQMDDGSHFTFVATTIDSTSLTGAGPPPGTASPGALIRQVLGDVGVTGTNYGTPDAATDSGWGFTVEIPYNHIHGGGPTSNLADAIPGDLVIVVVEVDHAGSGAHWEQTWNVLVTEPYQEV